jgi:hypothetical protein
LIQAKFCCAPGSVLTCVIVNHDASSSFSKIAAVFPIMPCRVGEAPAGGWRETSDPIELDLSFLKQLLQKRPAEA